MSRRSSESCCVEFVLFDIVFRRRETQAATLCDRIGPNQAETGHRRRRYAFSGIIDAVCEFVNDPPRPWSQGLAVVDGSLRRASVPVNMHTPNGARDLLSREVGRVGRGQLNMRV